MVEMKGSSDSHDEALKDPALNDLFDALRAVVDRPAPPVGAELASVLEVATAAAAAEARRRKAARAGIIGLVSAGIMAGGLGAAAANELPAPAQRIVSKVVNGLTPFDIPDPDQQGPVEHGVDTTDDDDGDQPGQDVDLPGQDVDQPGRDVRQTGQEGGSQDGPGDASQDGGETGEGDGRTGDVQRGEHEPTSGDQGEPQVRSSRGAATTPPAATPKRQVVGASPATATQAPAGTKVKTPPTVQARIEGNAMGLLGLGIFLAIVGAVLKLAVTAETPYVDIKKAGQILLFSGIAITALGLLLGFVDGSYEFGNQ